ncbi:MAG: beta-ribofuranosylaminobenzene 5'-phosphate synthase [Thermoprotei archaeon]
MSGTIKVEAHARLHVCLMDMNGSIGRVDGSVGIALSQPVIRVAARLSEREALHEELRPFAKRYFHTVQRTVSVELNLEECFERHVGLGSTTQLALSVGRSLSEAMGLDFGVRELARIMGRGGTSGIGVAAFEGGGSLIVDGGHRFGSMGKIGFTPSDYTDGLEPAKPIVKMCLPTDWRFVVAVPKGGRRVYGESERSAFDMLAPIPSEEVGLTSRIVLLKLLPAAVEGELEEFGEALNMLQKTGFKKRELELQPQPVRDLMVEGLRHGAAGAGMSSFGPTIYFLVRGDKEAARLAGDIHHLVDKNYVCSPWSGGARLIRD